MNRFALALSVGLMSTAGSSAARSAPTVDVPGWAQRFTQATLENDTESLLSLVTEIAAPGLNLSGMPQLLQSAKAITGGQPPESAEQFGEQNVGTFLKRINVAVGYPRSFLFYSVILGHHSDGWLLYSFKVDGNINNVINAPWPN